MNVRTVIVFAVLVLVGCIRKEPDGRLLNADELSDSSPEAALDSLYAIDYEQLSSSDRHFYDFLSVKITDKAYLKHASDSLIQDVIDYESRHKSNGRYAESLYYGGRVYKDLGDYPTSMRYFQEALEEVPSDEGHLDLKANIASQYGRLLNELRLYGRAIPLIKTAVEIGRQRNDSVNLIYDLQLLGSTCLKAEKYKDAEEHIREALELSRDKSSSLLAKSRMQMAMLKYRTSQIDSAIFYIHGVPSNVNLITRNVALAVTSVIYLKANQPDSVFKYANELLGSKDSTAYETAYHVLLSNELSDFVPKDSIAHYASNYRKLIESYQNRNNSELTITQESFYNYQLHVKEKEQLAKNNGRLVNSVFGLILVIVFMSAMILYYKNLNKAKIIELREALDNVKTLRGDLDKAMQSKSKSDSDSGNIPDATQQTESNENPKNVESNLRKRLQDELMSLYKSTSSESQIPERILQSAPYLKLQDAIRSNKSVKENDALWNEIEQVVLECSPKFRSNLNLLAFGNIKADDLHFALMVKCGIKPHDMTILLGKSNGAVISRRTSLCVKVLDEKYKAEVINSIIRLL